MQLIYLNWTSDKGTETLFRKENCEVNLEMFGLIQIMSSS